MYSNTLHLPHSLLSTPPILRYLQCFHLVKIYYQLPNLQILSALLALTLY